MNRMQLRTNIALVRLVTMMIACFVSSSWALLPFYSHRRRQTCFSSPASMTRMSSSSSLPDINFGLTDAEFRLWLVAELENIPGRDTYSDVYEDAIDAMVKWRQRYRGNPLLWKRIFKKDRVLKELTENAPIISSVRAVVESYEHEVDDDNGGGSGSGSGKITIMDLCSGKGYMSMFLSEMLPPSKVDKFLLIDKAWAMCNAKELKPHHMNWDHIYGTLPNNHIANENDDHDHDRDHDHKTYFTTWPIPLHTSKQDLKQSCNQRQMKKYIFDRVDGPIIILAVHLCGTLSLKAVDMFNHHDHVQFFALKPCCLPPMIHAQRGDVFKIGRHEFDPKEVCSNGNFNKKQWNGPPRWHLEHKFHLWADHLFKGIDIASDSYSNHDDDDGAHTRRRTLFTADDGNKEKREITIQVDGGFQNTYIFAERSPLTPSIWSD